MHDSSSFLQLGLILVLAAVMGAGAKFARQPVIVAYIFAGILAGPTFFGLVSDVEEVRLLAQIGIAVLLFLVGLKLDLHLIKTTGVIALLTGVGQVVFTSVIGYAILLALGFEALPALYIAVALTFSSTIIIVKLLSDKRELDQLHGRIAVGFLIVQDILVIVAMVVIVAIGSPEGAAEQTPILFIFLGSIAFLLAVAVLAKWVLPRIFRWLAKSAELTLLFGVTWAITLAGISAAIGLSMEIGAFVAGVALASTPYRESLGARMISLRDIMILFFFIELGAALDFSNALDQIWPALVLSAFVLIGNPIIVMVIMGVMGYRAQVSFKAGLAVAQISEFSLILIALGYSLGQVDEKVLSLVTIIGVVTITASTYLILYSEQIYQRLAPWLQVFERRAKDQLTDTEVQAHPYDAIVIGAGRLGSEVVAGLRARNAKLLVVDIDPQALQRLKAPNVDTLYGDVSDPDFAASLPIHEANTVVCAVPEYSVNLLLLETLQRYEYEGSICLTAMDDRSAAMLGENPGVEVIRPLRMAAKSVVKTLNIRIRAEETD
jgi:Kef-type K+ transport system membrane component KefB